MTWLKLAVDISQVVVGIATFCLLCISWADRKEKIKKIEELDRQ